MVTLEEAGQSAICWSKAWDAKIVPAVWWVYDHQVSKRAETGEFLPAGSFMIRGKKNFIYPQRLEMGVVLLYKLDETSLARHKNDRRIKSLMDDSETQSQLNTS